MMNDKPIVMHFTQPFDFRMIPTDAWEIGKARRGLNWLARLCFWSLKKLKCVHAHFDREQIYRTVYIDREQAASRVIELAIEQIRATRREPPERILLGRKEFNSLLDEECAKIPHFPRFTFDIEIGVTVPAERHLLGPLEGRYRTGRKFYNIPVDVIPWMDGVLVL